MSEVKEVVIPNGTKITAVSVVKSDETPVVKAEQPHPFDPRTLKNSPMKRPTVLKGFTYKLNWQHSERSIYMTFNFIVDDEGRKHPFEIFFKGGDGQNQDMLAILGRMTSSNFRRGGDIRHVVTDFVRETSPNGAFCAPEGFGKSMFVESLSSFIGYHILDAFLRIDYPKVREMNVKGIKNHHLFNAVAEEAVEDNVVEIVTPTEAEPVKTDKEEFGSSWTGVECPKCGDPTLKKDGGCDECLSCDYAKCS